MCSDPTVLHLRSTAVLAQDTVDGNLVAGNGLLGHSIVTVGAGGIISTVDQDLLAGIVDNDHVAINIVLDLLDGAGDVVLVIGVGVAGLGRTQSNGVSNGQSAVSSGIVAVVIRGGLGGIGSGSLLQTADGTGSGGGLLQLEDVDGRIGAHAVAGQVAAVNFQILSLAAVVGNSALDEETAFGISSFQNELGVVILLLHELNVSSVAEQIVLAGLEGHGAVLVFDDFQSNGVSLVLGEVQLPLVLAGVQIVRTGDELVLLGVSQHDGAAQLSLGGDDAVEGNGNFQTVLILHGGGELVVHFLGGCGDLDGGHVVLTGNSLDIFGLVGGPGDGVNNIIDTNLANHSVIAVGGCLAVLVHGVQVFCSSVQIRIFLGGAADKAADADCQEQNCRNNFFHCLFSLFFLMHGNIVIVHNFDLVIAIEAIHDALDINGLAPIGICGDHVAVIIRQNDGAHGNGHTVCFTSESHSTVGAVIFALGGVDALDIQILHFHGGAHGQLGIAELLGDHFLGLGIHDLHIHLAAGKGLGIGEDESGLVAGAKELHIVILRDKVAVGHAGDLPGAAEFRDITCNADLAAHLDQVHAVEIEAVIGIHAVV